MVPTNSVPCVPGDAPGTTTRLSRQAAVEAALRLVDERGLDALSMRNVAAAVGCPVMSLYRHVASREDLEDGIVALLVGGVSLTDAPDRWDGLLRGWATAYRDVIRAHPNAVPLVAARAAAGYASQGEGVELLLRLLVAAGDSPDDAIRHLRVALITILGYCHVEAQTGPSAAPEDAERVAAAGFPLLAGLMSRIGRDSDELFALMLDMVVGGIARDLP